METFIIFSIMIFFGLILLSFKTRNGQKQNNEGNTSDSQASSPNTYTDASDDFHHHHSSHSHHHHDSGHFSDGGGSDGGGGE